MSLILKAQYWDNEKGVKVKRSFYFFFNFKERKKKSVRHSLLHSLHQHDLFFKEIISSSLIKIL